MGILLLRGFGEEGSREAGDKNIKGHQEEGVPTNCPQKFSRKPIQEPLGVPHSWIFLQGLQANPIPPPALAVSVYTCGREYTQKTGQGPRAREKPQIQEVFKASFMTCKNQRRHKTLRKLKNYITRERKKNGEYVPTQWWRNPQKVTAPMNRLPKLKATSKKLSRCLLFQIQKATI